MAEPNNARQQPLAYEDAPFLDMKDDGDTNLRQMLTRHETLLSYLQAQRETDASRQLELLQAIKDELASQATPLHFISNAIIQVIFITSAFVFGLFTIYGVVYQIKANLLSVIQNQINLVAFCQTNNSTMYAKPCNKIMINAPDTVAWLAGETFVDTELSATWPWSVSDYGFLLTGWTYVVTFVPIGLFGIVGSIVTWRLYKGKFRPKKIKTSKSSKSESEIPVC